METDYILTLEEGDVKKEYFIAKAFLLYNRCYYIIIDLSCFNVMFGEYLGEFTDDMEATRERIYQEFVNRCPNVTFVDGYLLDEFYDMWDNGEI